jgi:putative flippase GtrA
VQFGERTALKWKNEINLNVRYGIAGLLNSLIGLSAIWALTIMGVVPIAANILGYALGLAFGFLNSRKFVFRSAGRFGHEARKYMVAFAVCYLLNIIMLQICISVLLLNVLLSQGIAVFSYVISMYLASRLYIFRENIA